MSAFSIAVVGFSDAGGGWTCRLAGGGGLPDRNKRNTTADLLGSSGEVRRVPYGSTALAAPAVGLVLNGVSYRVVGIEVWFADPRHGPVQLLHESGRLAGLIPGRAGQLRQALDLPANLLHGPAQLPGGRRRGRP
jgi:hypothetical protein